MCSFFSLVCLKQPSCDPVPPAFSSLKCFQIMSPCPGLPHYKCHLKCYHITSRRSCSSEHFILFPCWSLKPPNCTRPCPRSLSAREYKMNEHTAAQWPSPKESGTDSREQHSFWGLSAQAQNKSFRKGVVKNLLLLLCFHKDGGGC